MASERALEGRFSWISDKMVNTLGHATPWPSGSVASFLRWYEETFAQMFHKYSESDQRYAAYKYIMWRLENCEDLFAVYADTATIDLSRAQFVVGTAIGEVIRWAGRDMDVPWDIPKAVDEASQVVLDQLEEQWLDAGSRNPPSASVAHVRGEIERTGPLYSAYDEKAGF